MELRNLIIPNTPQTFKSLRWRSLGLFTLLLASLNPNLSTAETIRIPVGQQHGTTDVIKPTLGMSMERVRREFGDPIQELPTKGNPPITGWQYPGFVVYFEGHTVIHAVTRVAPITP